MRINVDPQALRGLADEMVRGHSELEMRLRSLEHCLQGGNLAVHESTSLQKSRAYAGDVLRCGQSKLAGMEGLIRFLRERAAAFEEADRAGVEAIAAAGTVFTAMAAALPESGGAQAAWWTGVPLLSIPLGQWMAGRLQVQNLPAWLQRLLGVEPSSPAPAEVAVQPATKTPNTLSSDTGEPTRLGALMQAYEEEREVELAAAAAARSTVPVLAQGDQRVNGKELMGGYGCVPTSVSMILGYYHAQDSNHTALSPVELFHSFDADDWDGSGGMGPHKLIDEVQDLGYRTVETHVNVSFEDLQKDLKVGPVLVTTQVGLLSDPRRVIPPSSTNASYHAMVVTGVSADGGTVFVNDPWGGCTIEYDRASFEAIWEGGGRGELVIQP